MNGNKLYNITLKYGSSYTVECNVVAANSERAIDRARVYAWRCYRWIKAKEWDVTYLSRTMEKIVA